METFANPSVLVSVPARKQKTHHSFLPKRIDEFSEFRLFFCFFTSLAQQLGIWGFLAANKPLSFLGLLSVPCLCPVLSPTWSRPPRFLLILGNVYRKNHTSYGCPSAFVATRSSVGRRAGRATSPKLLSQLTLSGQDAGSPKPWVVGSSPSAPAKKKRMVIDHPFLFG